MSGDEGNINDEPGTLPERVISGISRPTRRSVSGRQTQNGRPPD